MKLIKEAFFKKESHIIPAWIEYKTVKFDTITSIRYVKKDKEGIRIVDIKDNKILLIYREAK